MKISTSKHLTHNFIPKEVNSVEELARLITSGLNWSSGVFKDGHRKLSNFMEADTIALDIDDGMSIKDAMVAFKDYKHIIAPTQNHQKAKSNGKIADRYRVVLFLDKKVTNIRDYKATWGELRKQFPFIDEACSDASRYWKPSTEAVQASTTGLLVNKIESKEVQVKVPDVVNNLGKGTLSHKTKEFLLFGQRVSGWNTRLTSAVIDIREQGYSSEECISMCSDIDGELQDGDNRCIKSIYEREGTRYEPRIKKKSFKFQTIKDIYNNNDKLEWAVDRMMIQSGLSIIAGQAKSGKSTIIRQLATAVCQGKKFLGRDVKQGKVLYLALEEHALMLKKQFRQVGLKAEDPLYLHVGSPFNRETIHEDFRQAVQELEPTLVVIDTMHLFTGIQELNNYTEVNLELTKLREIARDSNTHIVVVHHQNKPVGGTSSKSRAGYSILGSTAIEGAVDCVIVFNRVGRDRFINTDLRGGIPFYGQPLEFDFETQTYKLGEIVDEF